MLNDHPEARQRLDEELVGWLTTVSSEGQPQASAVWHTVDDGNIVVYSGAKATRLQNIASNSRVAYNLRGDTQGDHVTTIEGTVLIDPDFVGAADNAAYVAKYETEMRRLGWTPEQFEALFPVVLRIKVARVRSS